MAAPMFVAGAEWLPSLTKLGGVAALARARPAIIRNLATQLASQSHRWAHREALHGAALG